MTRAWKKTWEVQIWWLLIDTLAYNFLKDWTYKDKSYLYYDWMVRDFFKYLSEQDKEKKYWLAVWSKQQVLRKWNFETKAKRCYELSLKAIENEESKYPYLADLKWKEIYWNKFKL